jgi:ATP-binding cassette subfamily C (CFTR/MRP) protein 1
MTTPATQLLQAMPIIAGGMGCMRRIHTFISSDAFEDTRDSLGRGSGNRPLGDLSRTKKDDLDDNYPITIISFNNVILASLENAEKNAITFEASRGTLTTVLGPVGSGKSTLLRSILGEIKPISGVISVASTYIGYCSQSPWLPNERIRETIVGPNDFDETWYQQVVKVCELESDFSQMPDNDLTIMGNRGITLSGGQKHRIVGIKHFLLSIVAHHVQSLARALYSRCSILVLDDFFSAIDKTTKRSIAAQLFGKEGHFQKHGCTVVFATHTSKH